MASSSLLYVQIHPDDNVLVATRDLAVGTELNGATPGLRVQHSVPMGHKVASRLIPAGTPVLRYGQPIGIAAQDIEAGQHVHVHNVRLDDRDRQYDFARDAQAPSASPPPRTFQGYRRASGRAGTRNYLGIISSVNCSASVSKSIARHFTRERLAAYPNVDGVVAFTHHGGCAMQFAGMQHRILNRVLGGVARHPNLGGFVLVGLGCEKATVDYLVDDQRLVQIGGTPESRERPPTLLIQNSGGTAATIRAGIEAVERLLPQVDAARREPIPVGELLLGTQCGGSDGSSGVTANPALGFASDLLVDHGGTTMLGETTECVGAEHLLTRRSVSEAVGRKLLERIEWWKWYAGLFGETIDDNRSSGNAAGGLTTIAEKSLGAVAKAGTRPVVEVYDYAEPVTKHGLVIMDSPGFDPASATGMVAGGANIMVFTTGRGSVYGCKPTPSIKVATNTPMYRRMEPDMDINAGRILEGASVQEVGLEIFEKMIAVASGEPTKSEAQGLGDEEFVPWMIGPVL